MVFWKNWGLPSSISLIATASHWDRFFCWSQGCNFCSTHLHRISEGWDKENWLFWKTTCWKNLPAGSGFDWSGKWLHHFCNSGWRCPRTLGACAGRSRSWRWMHFGGVSASDAPWIGRAWERAKCGSFFRRNYESTCTPFCLQRSLLCRWFRWSNHPARRTSLWDAHHDSEPGAWAAAIEVTWQRRGNNRWCCSACQFCREIGCFPDWVIVQWCSWSLNLLCHGSPSIKPGVKEERLIKLF